MALTLSSPAFTAGGDIPKLFTCDGTDLAPHLIWDRGTGRCLPYLT
jgi:phosphatidylethanolamine-binding protein (PEBP) family uncharacterized protein